MQKVRTRDGRTKHEPYPLSEFTAEVIESICKYIVYLKAVGQADMTGNQFSQIFADSISGTSHEKPLGIADASWNGCCWSVKTVKNNKPHTVRKVRLISGRNSPVYSSDITDPFTDVVATGRSVLEVYNQRIETARRDHDDIRVVILVRNMEKLEFMLFERPVSPFVVTDYQWKLNKRRNFEGYDGDRHAFTWQPHGAQFTIHEPIPQGATRFRINQEPTPVEMNYILDKVGFTPDWVTIL